MRLLAWFTVRGGIAYQQQLREVDLTASISWLSRLLITGNAPVVLGEVARSVVVFFAVVLVIGFANRVLKRRLKLDILVWAGAGLALSTVITSDMKFWYDVGAIIVALVFYVALRSALETFEL